MSSATSGTSDRNIAEGVESEPRTPAKGRRDFLKLGVGSLAVGAGAAALAACSTSTTGTAATSSTSLLDTWTKNKSAKIGVYVGGGATGFKDPSTGQLKGFSFDLTRSMFKDMSAAGDIQVNFVEFPFAQLFPALAGGQIDMIGHGVTILPSRALKSSFASLPAYYEGVVVWLKPGSTIQNLSDLNKSGVKIAVLAGSSQQFSGSLIFPKATLVPLADTNTQISETASGRADCTLIASQSVPSFAPKYPNMRVLQGPAVFVDANTYLMPLGDYKLKEWISNWLWYQLTHDVIGQMYIAALQADIQKAGLKNFPVFTPDTIGDVKVTNVS